MTAQEVFAAMMKDQVAPALRALGFKGSWETARAERPYLPKRPSGNIFYGGFAWQRRVGDLVPDRRERRWRVSADRPTEPVVADVLAAVRDSVLPAMRGRMA
jgi:hypothetical protein